MARNVFISFRYSDGHEYKDELAGLFDDSEDTVDIVSEDIEVGLCKGGFGENLFPLRLVKGMWEVSHSHFEDRSSQLSISEVSCEPSYGIIGLEFNGMESRVLFSGFRG